MYFCILATATYALYDDVPNDTIIFDFSTKVLLKENIER